MTWNLEELKNDVEILYDKEQLELLTPCLETIDEKDFYVHYHYNEVERLINNELKEIEPDNHELLKIALREDSEDYKNVIIVLKKAKAHIIACLQSLHSLADVFAHTIYYALKMSDDPSTRLEDRKITAYNVSQKLNSVTGADSLQDKYNSLRIDEGFIYLSDVVNCSKHRNIIKTNFWINLDQNKEYNAHDLEFYQFEFNQRQHARKRVIPFIKEEQLIINLLVVEIGIEVNRFVKNQLI